MPTALEGLDIGEVSGVDHPAHLEEGWMVLKAAGAAPEAIAKVEIVEALVDAVEKAAGIEPELLAQVGAEVLDGSARETLAHLLPTTKAKEANDMPDAIDKASLSPEALAYVESLEEKVAKAAETPAAPALDDEATALAKAMEGLPEPVRKHMEAQAEDLRKARETAETERNIRLEGEYLAKAKGFTSLTVKPEDLAGVLRKVAEVDADLFVQVDQILKAADAQVAEADLFKAAGAPAAVVASGSAHESLDAIAKAFVADGTAADYPTALAKAVEQNPALYADHRRESVTPQEG